MSSKTFARRLISPITGLLVLNFFFGFLPLIVGFWAGYQWNEVLGDFRRLFFYPLAALVSLSFILRPGDISRLLRLFAISLLVISIIALVRVVTGQTWDPEQFVPMGDFRAIGYFTGIIIVMGLGIFYGFSLVSEGYRKWLFLLASALLIGIGLLSGYRLLWAFLVVVPLFVSYTTYRGTRGTLALTLSLLLILVLMAGALFALQQFFPDLFLLMKTKFEERVLGFKFEENIRYFAWQTAWNRFLSAPITGVGIGDKFSFWGVSSAGVPHLFQMTTHNILLTFLYQTGIIGATLFILIHLRVFWYVWRRLPRFEPQIRAPLVGMLGGYLAALGLGMFQPVFEGAGPIVAIFLWIGLMLNIVRSILNEDLPIQHTQAS